MRFDKPRGSPEELGEFLIRSVGSRENPSKHIAYTFGKTTTVLFIQFQKLLYKLVLKKIREM